MIALETLTGMDSRLSVEEIFNREFLYTSSYIAKSNLP